MLQIPVLSGGLNYFASFVQTECTDMHEIHPAIYILCILGYFLLLIIVSYFTSRKADNDSFFRANRQSPWYLVAFGMIGASLSGVTFISIPGVVGAGGANQAFSYMQIVLGYLLGYAVIALVLLPLYYRMDLTSIYGYLEKRFGFFSYKTGAAYFLLSRTLGSALRLYLVAIVLDTFILGPYGVPFWATVTGTIFLIWIYTFKAGIRTIVFTDTLQTTFMLVAVVWTIIAIRSELGSDVGLWQQIKVAGYGKIFFFEGGWADPNNFFKQFFSGALITIVMTGLDQDMMQKNLTCKSLGDAQKNMFTFSGVLVIVNFLFLALGALLYVYASQHQIELPTRSDTLYPTLALQYLPLALGIMFLLGLVAAAYSSADSALTALTTSFCIDFLNFNAMRDEAVKKRKRMRVHIGFSILMILVIIAFHALNSEAVINGLFTLAGYTYGPILGLFLFGLTTKRAVHDKRVLIVGLAAPVLTYLLDHYSEVLFHGFTFGFLNLALNGLLTYLGLWLISRPGDGETIPVTSVS